MTEELSTHHKALVEQTIESNRISREDHIKELKAHGISNVEIERLIQPMLKSHLELEDYYDKVYLNKSQESE